MNLEKAMQFDNDRQERTAKMLKTFDDLRRLKPPCDARCGRRASRVQREARAAMHARHHRR
jgi:hypothetical protein